MDNDKKFKTGDLNSVVIILGNAKSKLEIDLVGDS